MCCVRRWTYGAHTFGIRHGNDSRVMDQVQSSLRSHVSKIGVIVKWYYSGFPLFPLNLLRKLMREVTLQVDITRPNSCRWGEPLHYLGGVSAWTSGQWQGLLPSSVWT